MKLGRPKIPKAERKGQITGVRLRSEERELFEKAAASHGKTLSDWMRETLLSAVNHAGAKL
ncbi:MAG TPA: DUF6290 family protein [Verrucomicrobiae bacterium]|jgi:uncharacterized protein (DUF1778 family)